jgi:hypothetical protein
LPDEEDFKYPGGWFGEDWGAQLCTESVHMATPVGEKCLFCQKTFVDGDQGLTAPHVTGSSFILRSIHIECFWNEVGFGEE